MWRLQEIANLLCRNLYYAVFIRRQQISYYPCQGTVHVPVVIRPATVIRSHVNKP